MGLPSGRVARVRVPATSANLGPGFDCMGLALDWYDELSAETLPEGLVVEVTGEGADQVPRTADHLVVRCIRDGLHDLGTTAPGLALRAHNTIPHSRGLGSSAAAIVAGLALAWGLARPDEPLDRGWLDELSSLAEGHPDNATAAVHGGAVLAWQAADKQFEVVELPIADGLAALVFVPEQEVPTAGARQVLPQSVPRLDAVRQASRSALLAHALGSAPHHLLAATEDLLHQPYRATLMADSADLVGRLRAAGVPAVISGAGPTVLCLGLANQLAAAETVDHRGFGSFALAVGQGVQLL